MIKNACQYWRAYYRLGLLAIGGLLVAVAILGEWMEQYRQRPVAEYEEAIEASLRTSIRRGETWLQEQQGIPDFTTLPAPSWSCLVRDTSDALLAYNDHKVRPPDRFYDSSPVVVQRGGSRWIVLQRRAGTLRYQLILPVVREYPVDNRYLQPQWPLLAQFPLRFSGLAHRGFQLLDLRLADYPIAFTLWAQRAQAELKPWTWFFGAGILCGSLGILLLTHAYLRPEKGRKGLVNGVGTFLTGAGIYYWLWKVLRLPQSVFSSDFFSSEYYASSPFLNSFGDVLMALTGLALVIQLLVCLFRFHVLLSPFAQGMLLTGFVGLSAVACHGMVLLLRSLVLNSDTLLDIELIHQLDVYSLVALLLALLVGGLNVMLHKGVFDAFQEVNTSHFWKKHGSWWYPMVALASLGIIAALMGRAPLFTALVMLAFWIPGLVQRLNWFRKFQLMTMLMWIVMVSLSVSLVLLQGVRTKERQMRRLYAYKLVSDQDGLLEYLVMQRLPRLKADPLVQQFFAYGADSVGMDDLQEHLRSYHFDGYLANYQVGLNARYTATFPLPEWLHQRFGGSYRPVGSQDLYFLSDLNHLATYYLRLQPPERLDPARVEQLVVRLTPENQARGSIFTDLLFGGATQQKQAFPDYAYAVYLNGRLQQQKGYYPYALQVESALSEGQYRFIRQKGFSHLQYQLSTETLIVVSLPERGWISSLSIFTGLLLIMLLLTALGYFVSRFRVATGHSIRLQIRPLPLHGRIRLVLVLLSSAALVMVYLATAGYLKRDFETQERQSLIDKMLEADRRLRLSAQRANFLPGRMADFPSNQQLREMARRIDADINWYTPDGRLRASSHPNLVERQVLPGLMNAKARRRLLAQGQAFLITEENISTLSYQAAYSPVYRSGTLAGFLGIPYYSQKILLKQELSALFINLLNWYLLVLAVVLIISFGLSEAITRPLQLISERLQKVELNKPLAPIQWKGRDELGQLVANYNAMIEELEKSARKLARQEREQAWQNMARQVAHEIKNPLTPIKLNLQQLEMTRQRDPQAMVKRFPKISTLIIHQIDQLTRIANEFSHFAKMPQGDMQAVDLIEVLEETRQLYQHDPHGRVRLIAGEVEAAWVYADRDHLCRLFSNLIKNALQALSSEKEGWVVLRLSQEASDNRHSSFYQVAVEDNGEGIPPEQLARIFQPNFSTKSSGMGLGLSMCHRIAVLCGGDISVDSRQGAWTVFRVRLPAWQKNEPLYH